ALFAAIGRKGLPDPFFRPADQPLADNLELLELLQAAYLPGALVARELAPVVERRRDFPAERVDILARQQQRIQQLGVANEPLRRQIARVEHQHDDLAQRIVLEQAAIEQ